MSKNKIFFEKMVEELFSISQQTEQLKSDLNGLQTQIKKLAYSLRSFTKNPLYLKKNALIVRFINSYMSKGFSYQDALLKTADSLNEDLKRCSSVFDVEKQNEKNRDKYALLFMIDKLTKANLPREQISKITGYSSGYIYDLIKKINQTRQKSD